MTKIQVKLFFILFITVSHCFLFPVNVYCTEKTEEDIQIQGFIQEKLKSNEIKTVKEAVDVALSKSNISGAYGFTSGEILNNALKGTPLKSLEGLPKLLIAIIGREVKANIALIIQLFAVMLLGAVIRALQPFENGIPNEATNLALNGALVIMASVSYGSMVDIARATIDSMQQISSLAMPSMLALMASTGRIVSVAALQPIMFVAVNWATYLFKIVILPITVMAGILFLVDSISVRFKLKTLAKLLKSCAAWATGIITLLFSILISVQKIAGSSVDAVAIRTTKYAIGTFVPIAGKYMADAAETILLCTSAASNFTGILTIIGLGIAFMTPFIKIFIVLISFRLVASIGAPICDEPICDSLEDSAECLSVMLGIMGASLFTNILLAGTMMQIGGAFA